MAFFLITFLPDNISTGIVREGVGLKALVRRPASMVGFSLSAGAGWHLIRTELPGIKYKAEVNIRPRQFLMRFTAVTV